jgi:RHS repeat-associated protein
VTINSSAADYRRGPYFREELAAGNTSSTNAVQLTVSVSSSPDTVGGNLLIPPSTQNFYYDSDGNLTNDNVWRYIFNGRNQLVEVQPLTNNPAATKRRVTYAYDYAGRRILKTVATLSGSTWSLTTSNRFLYDGWNCIAELNATNNAPIRAYLWGKDLSGSLQGAGGVGGLIAIQDAAQGVHFTIHDGSGNLVGLVNATNGAISARYEYDPFNRLIRMSGAMAASNPFHAADKYEDSEVGLVYYGHRYYHTGLQRWLNRDPIEEYGGLNVYGFCGNDPRNYVDPIGLSADDDDDDLTSDPTDSGKISLIGMQPPDDNFNGKTQKQLWFEEVPKEAATIAIGIATLLNPIGEEEILADVLGSVGKKIAKKCLSPKKAASTIGSKLKNAIKTGPKPGMKGPHNKKIKSVADELEEEGHKILAGGKRPNKPEAVIPTPSGRKTARRPDILHETPDGDIKATNVGRTKADGTPVKREVEAMEDLNIEGIPTDFVPYDK